MRTMAELPPLYFEIKVFFKGHPQKRETSKSQHKILKCYLAKLTNLGKKIDLK